MKDTKAITVHELIDLLWNYSGENGLPQELSDLIQEVFDQTESKKS